MIPSFFLCSLPGSGSATVAIPAHDLNDAVQGAGKNWNKVELGAHFGRLKKKIFCRRNSCGDLYLSFHGEKSLALDQFFFSPAWTGHLGFLSGTCRIKVLVANN